MRERDQDPTLGVEKELKATLGYCLLPSKSLTSSCFMANPVVGKFLTSKQNAPLQHILCKGHRTSPMVVDLNQGSGGELRREVPLWYFSAEYALCGVRNPVRAGRRLNQLGPHTIRDS